MLNILEMIHSLEVEIKDLKVTLNEKQARIDKYERELGPLRQEVTDINDTLSGLQMALDSLNMVTVEPKTDINAVHDDPPVQQHEESEPLKFTNEGMLIGDPVRRSTKPKGVIKKDAYGNIIAQYRSVNEAARDNNFDSSSLRNIILKISREKQIRQRGCYYVYS